jgi:urease accessory protein
MNERLLTLLQLTDSGFPTGGYAFSHGLEGLHGLGIVRDAADVESFARTQIEETLGGIELPGVWHAWHAATDGDHGGLIALDALLDALKPVPVHRVASTRIGRRFLESAAPLVATDTVASYRGLVAAGNASGHHAVTFGIVTAGASIPAMEATIAFGAASLQGYVAAAVRLGVIGQTVAQAIIRDLHPALIDAIDGASRMELDELGGYTPLIDLAGLRHAAITNRLFTS